MYSTTNRWLHSCHMKQSKLPIFSLYIHTYYLSLFFHFLYCFSAMQNHMQEKSWARDNDDWHNGSTYNNVYRAVYWLWSTLSPWLILHMGMSVLVFPRSKSGVWVVIVGLVRVWPTFVAQCAEQQNGRHHTKQLKGWNEWGLDPQYHKFCIPWINVYRTKQPFYYPNWPEQKQRWDQ